MKIKIEFSRSRAFYFPWVLRVCKTLPSYKETFENGIEIHAVEFDFEKDWYAYEAIYYRLASWKNTAFYLDGTLVPSYRILSIHYLREERRAAQSRREKATQIPARGRIEVDPEYGRQN